MGKVYCRNPQNGVVYVYSSEGYYDEEAQKYKYRRRVLAKIDPVTGAEVPTGPVGRPKKERSEESAKSSSSKSRSRSKSANTTEDVRDLPEFKALMAQNQELKQRILTLEERIHQQDNDYRKLVQTMDRNLRKVTTGLNDMREALGME